MSNYTQGSNNSNGRITDTTDECPLCGANTRRYGTSDQSGAKIEQRCPTHGPVETPIVADGRGNAYDVLATFNDPAGYSDRLQQYLNGDLTANNLVPHDIARPLRLSVGELCLEVRHEYKTEYIWATKTDYVSRTVFDDASRSSWGPIHVDAVAIAARLNQNKEITVRLTERVDVARPETAYAQEVRA